MRACRTWLPGDGDALRQCICGHQRHRGKCGKPRYVADDLCECEVFIDSSACVSGPGLRADKSTRDSVAGTEPAPREDQRSL